MNPAFGDRPPGIAWKAPIPATWVLVGLIVAVHLATGIWLISEGKADLGVLFLQRGAHTRSLVGGQLASLVSKGEMWRLCTSILLHVEAFHLLTNAVGIATLGRFLEPWIGGLRLWSWFVIAGVAGSALTQATGVVQSDGASGGAFGLLGALVVIAWRYRGELSAEDRRLLGPVLWGFVGVNLILSLALPFVNAAGHLGGLIAGLLVGYGWEGPRRAGTAFHVVVVGAWAIALAWGWVLKGM